MWAADIATTTTAPATTTGAPPSTTTVGSPPGTTTVATLSWDQTLTTVGIIAVAVVVAGIVVMRARRHPSQGVGASVVRSWIAITLVLGLVVFCALTLAVADQSLRSTLVGALTASVGAAIAFYFASKSSEQARQDLLAATVGTEAVPDLDGKTEADATMAMGRTSLQLVIDPAALPTATATVVVAQAPLKDSVVPKGSPVKVSFGSS